jgi:uncharacterized repeat protein (TIGR01451 family)/CSLREA domain-containing protein
MPEKTLVKGQCLFLVAVLLAALALRPAPVARAATIVVNSTADAVADDGQCTLREAITAVNTDTASGGTPGECDAGSGDDTIDLTGISGTIDLTGPLPEIISDVVLSGPGASNLMVRRDTGGDYRVCTVSLGATVTISGLTLSNGRVVSDYGGGIYNAGTLTLSNSTIGASNAYLGGGIFNAAGKLSLSDSMVSGNSAEQGGGIDNDQGVVELVNSAVNDNYAASGGGGIANLGSTTLDNGTISGNSADYGGGVYNVGTMTVMGSILGDNDASSDGGGISNSNAGLMALTNSVISGNSASRGGGVYNDPNSTVTLANSSLSSNSADYGGGVYNEGMLNQADGTVSSNEVLINGHGGGIYNSVAGTMTLSNSTVSSNRIHIANDSYGGGIYNAGTLTLNRSAVSFNVTNYGDRCHGGGLYNAGTLTLNDSTVSGNNASDQASYGDGGGIYNVGSGSAATLNNSTVSANHSSSFEGGDGGGIWNGNGAALVLNNSTVGLNGSSNNGGGIYNTGNSTLTLNNSTVGKFNLAGGSGGGIWNDNSGTVNLKNSIVARNGANSGGPDCYNAATLTSLDYNLLADDSDCSFTPQSNDQVNVDPLLGELQDNGGSTETSALLLGSPAFDAVPVESCSDHQGTPIIIDQRGVSRPQGPACDIGAYEAESADLNLSKTVDETSPAASQTVGFTIQVFNDGPLGATGVVISDVLPLGLTYVSSFADQGSYTSATGEWSVGSLTVGLSATLILTVTVDAGMEGTAITNTAAITAAEQFDSWIANNAAMAAVAVVDTAPTQHHIYLPLILCNYPLTFPLYIGDAIAVRPVAYRGEVFYTNSVWMPDELPSSGHFYFSSERDTAAAALVDDKLAVLLDDDEIFAYDFSTGGYPQPAIVEVPWTTMEQWAGQNITIEYRDVYSSLVEASTMWLIWSP